MNVRFVRCLVVLMAVDASRTQSVRFSPYRHTTCPEEPSKCVVVTECKAARSKIRTGQNPKICGWSSKLPLICCPEEEEIKTPPDESGQSSHLSPEGCGRRIAPLISDDPVKDQPPASRGTLESGIDPRRAPSPVDTDSEQDDPSSGSLYEENTFSISAVGGTAAAVSWPWMAAIFDGNRHLCGGTLIDDRHVITAAHCFEGRSLDPNSYKLQIGELYLNRENAVHDVEDIKPHEGYINGYYYDDIAIIRLATSLPDLTPACLPADDSLQHGDNVTVLGWGDLSFGGPSTSELQEVMNIPIVSRSECDAKYRTLRRSPFPRGITSAFLCAGLEEGGKDACQGDSGGPLLHESPKDRWTLVGVVSFGYKCAEPGYPGVYTKVFSYISWIEEYVFDRHAEVIQQRSRSARFGTKKKKKPSRRKSVS